MLSFAVFHWLSAPCFVPVHREAERDEAGGADGTRADRVILLPFPRQIQGNNNGRGHDGLK